MSQTMECPNCRGRNTVVKDSRRGGRSPTVRRRRLCATCGHRFTTHEWESTALNGLRDLVSKLEMVERQFSSMAVHMAALRSVLDATVLPEDDP